MRFTPPKLHFCRKQSKKALKIRPYFHFDGHAVISSGSEKSYKKIPRHYRSSK